MMDVKILGESKESVNDGEYHTIFMLAEEYETYLLIEQLFYGKRQATQTIIMLSMTEARQLYGILKGLFDNEHFAV